MMLDPRRESALTAGSAEGVVPMGFEAEEKKNIEEIEKKHNNHHTRALQGVPCLEAYR